MLYNASLYWQVQGCDGRAACDSCLGKHSDCLYAHVVYGLGLCPGPRQAAPNGPCTKTHHEASEQHGRARAAAGSAAHSRRATRAACTLCVHSGGLRSARLRTDGQCGRLLSSERSARRTRTLTNFRHFRSAECLICINEATTNTSNNCKHEARAYGEQCR